MQRLDVLQWQSWYWECRDADRDRYYVIHVQQYLWGNWEMYKVWGGRGTRRAENRVVVLERPDEALPQVRRCHRRRLSHGYRLVLGHLGGQQPGDGRVIDLSRPGKVHWVSDGFAKRQTRVSGVRSSWRPLSTVSNTPDPRPFRRNRVRHDGSGRL
jgi:hypothetical protein